MPLCRFVGGLGPGFLIDLFISIRHDMDRIAMADTPRNSAADRIKNSTDDSILKSYRGMPVGDEDSSARGQRLEVKGKLTARCNRSAALRCWDPKRSGAGRRRKPVDFYTITLYFLLSFF
jgi:hypothetical protein